MTGWPTTSSLPYASQQPSHQFLITAGEPDPFEPFGYSTHQVVLLAGKEHSNRISGRGCGAQGGNISAFKTAIPGRIDLDGDVRTSF